MEFLTWLYDLSQQSLPNRPSSVIAIFAMFGLALFSVENGKRYGAHVWLTTVAVMLTCWVGLYLAGV